MTLLAVAVYVLAYVRPWRAGVDTLPTDDQIAPSDGTRAPADTGPPAGALVGFLGPRVDRPPRGRSGRGTAVRVDHALRARCSFTNRLASCRETPKMSPISETVAPSARAAATTEARMARRLS